MSEAKTQSALNASKIAAEANTDSVWYNNGTENRRFHDEPSDGWVLGMLISTTKKESRSGAISAAIKGKKTYNDGVRNFFVADGDYIDPSWKQGMAPQKKRAPKEYQSYNDGNTTFQVKPGDVILPNWKRGKLKPQ